MNKKTLAKIVLTTAVIAPLFVYAADVNSIVQQINTILKSVVPVLMILATVVFLWGVILYVVAGSDEEKVTRAKGFIITGLVGLFVMIAVWGVVQAIASTFGVQSGTIPPGPGNVAP